MAKTPSRSEADIQRSVIDLFTLAGFVIYNTSQGYRKEPGGTRMTRGLADLILFHPALQRMGGFEVKTPEGLRLHQRGVLCQGQPKDILRAQGQQRFGRLCLQCGGFYGIGGMPEAWALLVSLGLAEPEPTSIGGYRLRVPRETR